MRRPQQAVRKLFDLVVLLDTKVLHFSEEINVQQDASVTEPSVVSEEANLKVLPMKEFLPNAILSKQKAKPTSSSKNVKPVFSFAFTMQISYKVLFFHKAILRSDYTNIMYSNFHNHRPCVLVFKTKNMHPNRKNVSSPSLSMYCQCKEFPTCKRYKIETFDDFRSGQLEFLTFFVSETSIPISHSKEQENRRKLTGEKRLKVGEQLANAKSIATFYYDQWKAADEDDLKKGNYSETHNLHTLEQLAYQNEKAEKLHTDDLIALKKLKAEYIKKDKTSKVIKGFISDLHADPFTIVLCSENQIKCYVETGKRKEIILLIDATGCMMKKPNADTTMSHNLLYYVIMLKGIKYNVPVMSFITENHSALDLSSMFNIFLKKCLMVSNRILLPQLVVLDNSKALLNSCLRSFSCQSICDYLEMTWNYQRNHVDIKDKTLFHWCSAHFIRQCAKHTKAQISFPRCRTLVLAIIQLLICSSDFNYQEQLLILVATLLGNKYLTDNVQFALLQYDEFLNSSKNLIPDIEEENNEMISSFDIDEEMPENDEMISSPNIDKEIPENDEMISSNDMHHIKPKPKTMKKKHEPKTIKESSPYYRHFKPLMEGEECDYQQEDLSENPYFAPKFLSYFIENAVAYLPLWTSTFVQYYALQLNERERTMLTTNIDESQIKDKKARVLDKVKYVDPVKAVDEFYQDDDAKAIRFLFTDRRGKKAVRKDNRKWFLDNLRDRKQSSITKNAAKTIDEIYALEESFENKSFNVKDISYKDLLNLSQEIFEKSNEATDELAIQMMETETWRKSKKKVKTRN